MDIRFLSVEEVLLIQSDVLVDNGGQAGVRDLGLLTSAIMMPQQTFGGEFVHEDLAAMAAAYLFHLAKNHPFFDGNKRAALACAMTFLIANGLAQLPDQDIAADITLAVASGAMSKDELTLWFRMVVTDGGSASRGEP